MCQLDLAGEGLGARYLAKCYSRCVCEAISG